ncbi:MAG: hypothetical protein EPN36_13080 [Rhodanobacteraceae bacterium]|nr:MAG: hypothetical protein EPN36_13080 [Rhodanobacteraceae bacterium]
MNLPRARQLRRWLGLLSGVIALGGCVLTPRLPPPPNLINNAAPEGFPPDIRLLTIDRERFARELPELLKGLGRSAPDGKINILVLSGGGAGGAFGAGALVGLSEAHARPQFQVVTGVSAGALVAPFAFLGPAWDPQLRQVFEGDEIEHLQRSPTWGVIGRILFPQGIGGHDALAELVDHSISDAMIDAVASAARTGRKLIVATTDLDDQETVLWDMGAIAMQGTPAAHALFRKVLTASASVPGVFPPVLIRVRDGDKVYDEMHVDGSVTTPLFAAPLIAHVMTAEGSELKGANLYVIVNGKLAMEPKETPINTIRILMESFSAQITYKTRDALTLVLALAHRDHMHFRLADIPVEYPSGSFLDFHRAHLRQLFDYGETCARQGLLWADAMQSIRHTLYRYPNESTVRTDCPAAVLQESH